jgi:hypothetical protein
MNVVIEVVAAEGTTLMTSPKVKTQKVFFSEVAALTGVVTTSVLRALRQGRSSQNAVSPVHTLIEGGLAVA